MNANVIRTITLTLCLVLGSVCVNAQDFLSNQNVLNNAIFSKDTVAIKQAIKNGAMLNTRTTLTQGINILPGFLAIESGVIKSPIERDKKLYFPGHYQKLAEKEKAEIKEMVPYSYKYYEKKKKEVKRKDPEDIDISILKFLAEGFEITDKFSNKKFVKLDVNKEAIYYDIKTDILTFAIEKDNIPAVEYLNSLEGVSVNDKTSDGIPKLFYVQSLEMLKFLTEEQNANIFLKTDDGADFVNYLFSEININDPDQDKIISLIHYLAGMGVPLLDWSVNPIANAIKSHDPYLIESIIETIEFYGYNWLLCDYLSQPDKDGKNLITHLIENIGIYENSDENITIEIDDKKYNILEYIIYLLEKYDYQCQSCGINLLPLSQYKDENGQPAIYKLEPTQKNIFVLDKLTDNPDSSIIATTEKEVLFDLNIFENQEISLLEKDKYGKIYLNYISDMLYEVSSANMRYPNQTQKYFKNLFTKTLNEIFDTINPYRKSNIDLDKKLVEAFTRNDFIDFVQLALAGANVNQVDEYGIPLIQKALEEYNTAIALYIAKHSSFDSTIQTSNGYYAIDWAVYYSNPLVFETLVENGSEINYKTKQRAKKRLKEYSEDVRKIANKQTSLFAIKNRDISLYIDDLETKESETKKAIQKETLKGFTVVRQDFPF